MLLKGTERGVVLGQLTAEASRTQAGTQITREWLKENRKSVVERINNRAEGVLTCLIEGVVEKVYSEDPKEILCMNIEGPLSVLARVDREQGIRSMQCSRARVMYATENCTS